MNDRRLIEEYDDSVMRMAVSELMEEYGKELEKEALDSEELHADSAADKIFYSALNREYRKSRIRAFAKKAGSVSRYAVTACAAVIVIFSISVISVDAVRLKFLDWLTGVNPSHNSYDNRLNDNFLPEYVPEGYILQYYNVEYSATTIIFKKDNSFNISIMITTDTNVTNIDNESGEAETIDIGNYSGVFSGNGNKNSLLCSNGKTFVSIVTNDPSVEKQEFINILQSFPELCNNS